jgi:predicted nucleic acid-binding Zn ribbon protein
MAGKNSKIKKQPRTTEETNSRRQRATQIFFAVFAVILILSMVLSAVTTSF